MVDDDFLKEHFLYVMKWEKINYIEHLETYCGEINGHLEIEELEEQAIQVVRFQNAPFTNANTVNRS